MSRHTHMHGLQPKIQEERIHRCLNRSEISHELSSRFRNKCALLTKFLGISNPMVRFIRCRKPRKFICMSKPVKFTGIYDTSSDGRIMSIHILGSGVCYNIRSPFKWAAVDRCRKGIVHDQRNTMSMCCVCKPLDVKYDQCRVGDCLSEYGFRIWLKSRFQLFVRTVRIYECKINSHTFHRYGKQVICSAIYRRGRYDMISCAADVKY